MAGEIVVYEVYPALSTTFTAELARSPLRCVLE